MRLNRRILRAPGHHSEKGSQFARVSAVYLIIIVPKISRVT